MLVKWMQRIILCIFLFPAFIFSVSHADSTLNIKRLIILGDSLSDNGNDYLLTSELHARFPAIPIFPSPSLYWQGRFSDGPTWPEYLASMLNFMPAEISNTQRQSEQFQNLAYGGAWAESDNDQVTALKKKIGVRLFPPSLEAQTELYLINTVSADPDHFKEIFAEDLVFVWAGGNDYLNQGPDGPLPQDPEKVSDQVIVAIRANVVELIEAGVKNLVLLGLPDLSNVPDVYLRDPERKSLSPTMTSMSLLHNQKLQKLIADLSKAYTDTQINYFDIEDFFQEEFRDAKIRKQTYASTHDGKWQKSLAPCLLDSTDPDPTLIGLFGKNRMLNLSVAPQQRLDEEFRKCDLHQANDHQSSFNFLEDYEAGGIFYDHVHPLTQMHAKIALGVCHLLNAKGYAFYQNPQKQFIQYNCEHDTLYSLLHRIQQPPFPFENNKH